MVKVFLLTFSICSFVADFLPEESAAGLDMKGSFESNDPNQVRYIVLLQKRKRQPTNFYSLIPHNTCVSI